MSCPKRSLLYTAIKSHRDFHFKTGLISDKVVRLFGVHKCPLTSPLYKLAKVAGYANVAAASIALVVLE
ncbi:hypothetical protein Syn7502_01244 [Synechococcus sp. PCC 7502]|uniref:hypothetical protein n=1 Tax=Synechococcus sp. PCC 7502 TaxID=1173263 RepID=UPI00029FD3FF|nr:hypothetical protein [Synechococcus sp. PCC 7502]AFY73343.1 hypothetical protein Syn7502_01244 [Synechococcus sp. PCC 7502]